MLFNRLTTVFTIFSSLHLVSACYIHHRRPSTTTSAGVAAATTSSFNGITADQIRQVAPSTASCGSLASCRTADQAVTFINKSFQKFNFTTVGEQAALFSLMAFESGDFQYDVNVSPGRPGQGTRNMMEFDFILPYAMQFNASAVHAIRPDLTSQSTAADVPSDDQKNAIRATVLGDELSFASAAWFLRTQCASNVAQALQAANEDGFNTYMSCVGVQDPARLALYQATLTAMGH